MTIFNCLELRGGDAPREQAGGGDVAAKNKAGVAAPAFEPEIRIARVTG